MMMKEVAEIERENETSESGGGGSTEKKQETINLKSPACKADIPQQSINQRCPPNGKNSFRGRVLLGIG